MSRSTLFLYRDFRADATQNFQERGRRVNFLFALQTIALSGFRISLGSCLLAQVNYLLAQTTASSNTVPDALGTTVLTVGGGGLAIALAAISKDFWAYKKYRLESDERREKEDRESKERLESQRLAIERTRVSLAKNDRMTNTMLDWMVKAHETQSFPPPPPRVKLHDDRRIDPL